MSSYLGTLPDDLLYHIISYLRVQDTVRLRQVCTEFERVTRERTVWVNAYKNATVLRPPGPYIYQSTKDLEEHLVMAIRLHTNWSSPNPRPVTMRSLLLTNDTPYISNVALVMGRFLLVGKPGLLTCYDLDSDDDWTLPIASYIAFFDTMDFRVTTDADGGKSAVVALFRTTAPFSSVIVLKLLLPPSPVSFQLELTTDTDWQQPGRFTWTMIVDDYLVMSKSPETKIFHLPTRRYYRLPEPGSWASKFLDITQYQEHHLTSTHFIFFCSAALGTKTVIQAFLLPHVDDQLEPSSEPIPALTRTHVGYCDFTFTESELLHSPALNLGSFTFMAFEVADSGPLPANNLVIVDTILSSEGQSLGTITATKKYTKALGSLTYNVMPTSYDGITRAVTYSGISAFTICGFTVVSNSQETSVEGRTLFFDKNYLGNVIAGAFDGYRGRICLGLQSPASVEIQDYV